MKSKNNRRFGSEGFTLLELFAVIAVLTVLAITLLPVLAGAKVRTHIAVCMDNQRQIALGWQLYADDNNGRVIDHGDSTTNSWRVRPGTLGVFPSTVTGQGPVTSVRDAAIKADQLGYRLGGMYRYAKNANILHCPADFRLNAASGVGYITYTGVSFANTNTADILNPAGKFLFIEENDYRATSVNFQGSPVTWNIGEHLGTFDLNANRAWWDAPANFHRNSTVFSFADGHVENHRWQDNATLAIAAYTEPFGGKAGLAQQVTLTSSPTGGPLFTDGLGAPNDLPFYTNGLTFLEWP